MKGRAEGGVHPPPIASAGSCRGWPTARCCLFRGLISRQLGGGLRYLYCVCMAKLESGEGGRRNGACKSRIDHSGSIPLRD
jgi:hypothetical protein